uniref:Uncharacterized protein n=1 Tax=Glycine max TaxID=3847 RepID=A0A0R0JQC9_SOYBN
MEEARDGHTNKKINQLTKITPTHPIGQSYIECIQKEGYYHAIHHNAKISLKQGYCHQPQCKINLKQ